MKSQEGIIKSSRKANSTCCLTGIHFTKEDICIMQLKPNHYEEDSIEENKKPQSDFVKSIMASRFPFKEDECKHEKVADSEFSRILKDITNDLSLK